MSREGKEPIVKLLVTIMDRGKGERAVEFYRSRGLPYHFITLGFGTANSQILDYFGLSETEKDIVLTLVQEERALRLLQDTTAAFRMTGPGRGDSVYPAPQRRQRPSAADTGIYSKGKGGSRHGGETGDSGRGRGEKGAF